MCLKKDAHCRAKHRSFQKVDAYVEITQLQLVKIIILILSMYSGSY